MANKLVISAIAKKTLWSDAGAANPRAVAASARRATTERRRQEAKMSSFRARTSAIAPAPIYERH